MDDREEKRRKTYLTAPKNAKVPIAVFARKGGVNMTTVKLPSCSGRSVRCLGRRVERNKRVSSLEKPVVDRTEGVGLRARAERVDFRGVEPGKLKPRKSAEQRTGGG